MSSSVCREGQCQNVQREAALGKEEEEEQNPHGGTGKKEDAPRLGPRCYPLLLLLLQKKEENEGVET